MSPYRKLMAALLVLGLMVSALPGPAHAQYYYDRFHHRHYRPLPHRHHHRRYYAPKPVYHGE